MPEHLQVALPPQGGEERLFRARGNGEAAGEKGLVREPGRGLARVFGGKGQAQSGRGQTFAHQALAVAGVDGPQAREQGGGRRHDLPFQVGEVAAGHVVAEKFLHAFGEFHAPGEKAGHVRGEVPGLVRFRGDFAHDVVEDGHAVEHVEHHGRGGGERCADARGPVADGGDFRQQQRFVEPGHGREPVAEVPGGPAQGEDDERVREVAVRCGHESPGHGAEEFLGPGDDADGLHEAASTGRQARLSR